MDITAMQEMINWIEEMENSIFGLSATPLELRMLSQFKQKCKQLLKTEKEQLVDARATLYAEFLSIHINAPRKYCEEWFEKKYSQKTKTT